MEKTYIIGSSQQLNQLGFNLIELPKLSDEEIHDWVVNNLASIEYDKLIIDLSEDPVKTIKVALHIRLSLNELSSKALTPILLISPSSLNQIIIDGGIWSQIFATKGLFFTSYENTKNEVNEIIGLRYDEYRTHFLDVINIRPDESVGRHSLANQWGAYTMAKAANSNSLSNNLAIKKAEQTLYFKFIAAHSFNFKTLDTSSKFLKILGKIYLGSPDKITANGKRIILIDDEADKGWEEVLRSVFETDLPGDFCVINKKAKNFDSFTKEEKDLIVNGNFDLFLIDLRLNGVEEEGLSNPKDFSGTKVLTKIKELNKGNQVIMFTASNKAWNMKALLDLGANGYYIKESPEYNFPLRFSEENYKNFKDEVKNCLDRSYLRTINKLIETIQKHTPDLKNIYGSGNPGQDLYDQLEGTRHWMEIKETLNNIFFNLNSDLPERFNLSMLLLFRNLELLTELFYGSGDPIIFRTGEYKKLLLDDYASKKYYEGSVNSTNEHIQRSTGNKVQTILYQKLGIQDYNTLKDIQKFAKFRNDFLHPERRYELNEVTATDILNWLGLQKDIFTRL